MENCTYTNPENAIILLVITWLQLCKKEKNWLWKINIFFQMQLNSHTQMSFRHECREEQHECEPTMRSEFGWQDETSGHTRFMREQKGAFAMQTCHNPFFVLFCFTKDFSV